MMGYALGLRDQSAHYGTLRFSYGLEKNFVRDIKLLSVVLVFITE